VHVIDKVLYPFYDTIASVAADKSLTNLTAAINAAGPDVRAIANDPYFNGTVVLPTNAAFAAYLSARRITQAQLLSNPRLSTLLAQHVLNNTVVRTAGGTTTVNTLGG
jgi:hypothetical protein